MVHNHKRETLKETIKLISKRIKLNNFPSAIKSLQKVETSVDFTCLIQSCVFFVYFFKDYLLALCLYLTGNTERCLEFNYLKVQIYL